MIGAWGLCGPEKEEGKVCLSTVLQDSDWGVGIVWS